MNIDTSTHKKIFTRGLTLLVQNALTFTVSPETKVKPLYILLENIKVKRKYEELKSWRGV